MSISTTSLHSPSSGLVDDELIALNLQLEELGVLSQTSKGKHAVNNPPDYEVAFASFQAELQDYKTFLDDQKLAQSIGAAVHTDGVLIGDITTQDLQAHEDRRYAVQLSNNDPEIEGPPRSVRDELQGQISSWMSTMASTVAANSVIEFSDDESEAGPSMGFAERQAETIKKLSAEFQCSACTDRFPRAHMITAKCSHRYCTACIKHLFMRSTNDESLYPPRCCKQEIPLALVSKHMNPEELATFQLARVEHATVNKTYCSDHACGEFIIPDNIEPGTHRATCTKCGTTTCSICKNGVHAGDCPDDESLRQTREMARVLGWQACYSCNRVVQLRSGCNHITCRCRAEFCYVCGAAWKTCACANADINRIEERAEEVVDRDAPRYLPPAERRARVDQVFADLQENHECTHSRRFQRLTNAPRRGYRCELCDAQHYKYILQCRQCYVNVCEECRRNRI